MYGVADIHAGASVQTVVRASNLDSSGSGVSNPVLRPGAVAVVAEGTQVSLHQRVVCLLVTGVPFAIISPTTLRRFPVLPL